MYYGMSRVKKQLSGKRSIHQKNLFYFVNTKSNLINTNLLIKHCWSERKMEGKLEVYVYKASTCQEAFIVP